MCVVYLLYKSEREILKEEVIRRKEEREEIKEEVKQKERLKSLDAEEIALGSFVCRKSTSLDSWKMHFLRVISRLSSGVSQIDPSLGENKYPVNKKNNKASSTIYNLINEVLRV